MDQNEVKTRDLRWKNIHKNVENSCKIQRKDNKDQASRKKARNMVKKSLKRGLGRVGYWLEFQLDCLSNRFIACVEWRESWQKSNETKTCKFSVLIGPFCWRTSLKVKGEIISPQSLLY